MTEYAGLLTVFILAVTLQSPLAQVQDAAYDGPRLVWTELHTTERRARINSLAADPGEFTTSAEVTTRFYYQKSDAQFVGIANDYANRTAFWSDTSNRTIYRGELGEGANGQSMFTGTSKSVEGLAVDWLAKNVYWTDSSYDWIMISDYSATNYNLLVDTGLEKPRGIATFPQRGYLFWTDWGERKKIERSTLAGLNRTTIVDTNIHFPNGIAVDYEAERVYWVDAIPAGNRIESCRLDGSNRTLLIELLPRVAHLFDLVINGNNIYVTDLTRQLRCIKKDTGKVGFSLNLGARPFGVMMYGPGFQQQISSPCDSNPCQHLCTGTPEGDYQCLCRHGYQITSNGTSCVRDEDRVAKPQLLLVSRNDITRYPSNFADLAAEQTRQNRHLVANRSLLVAIDVDSRAEMMFFSDYGKREIYRVRLISGHSIKTIVGGVGSAEGLAVDWLNQNLYWSDASRRHIAVSRYDGSRRKFLYEDDVIRPRSLVLHATRRLMFWTEFGPPAQIERGSLDGSSRMVIKTGLDSPNGLAIDFNADRLYYATRGNGAIDSIDFNGEMSRRVYLKSGAKYFDIELFHDYLYFTEWGTDNGLHAINLNNKELVKSMPMSNTAYGVRMYDESRQPGGSGVCDEDSCDHLCLPSSEKGFVCHCSIGFTLAADNTSCTVDILEDNFVLMADTHYPGIFQMSMESGMDRFTALPLEELVRPIALAYDPVETRVYWTDVRLGSFSRAFLNGSGQETLGRSGIDGPDGLTIDPLSRLLYWTDVTRNTITVSSLDGTQIKTLIDTDLDQPRAIVLNPVGGYMYYSDWGAVAKIEKAHMDGSNREVLVDSDLAWPNGLALDLEGNKLYWGDAKLDRIERINLDGTGRELIVNLAPRGHPYGVAIYGPDVYWSDWKQYGLMKADKDTGNGMTEAGPQTFSRISEIHVYNSSRELSGSNACTTNNGGCSHLCIPTPIGRNCTCPDGIQLDIETNTQCLMSNLTCSSLVPYGRFLTEDCTFKPGRRCTVECIPGYWNEDGEYDILCMANGQWETEMDTFCTVVQCPKLNVTANASVAACADPPIQNSTCIHECEIGYKRRSGIGSLTCEKDGTWSGSQLYCSAITCPALENPENGLWRPEICTTTGGRFDAQCSLFCQHGFHHEGVSVRSCQLDGTWADEEIVSTCIDTDPPTFGTSCAPTQNLTAIRGQTFVEVDELGPMAQDNSGGAINYSRSLTPPYRFEEGDTSVIIVATDESNNTAVCEFIVTVEVKSCQYLSIPLNGQLAENCTYHYGSVCHFSCIEGFRLQGSGTRTCELDSTDTAPRWVGEKAVCEAVICPPPQSDAMVFQSGCEAPYTAGTECTYMCAPGFHQVNGTALRTCQDDGTWSGDRFYCHVQVCDPIPTFEHGVIFPESCQTVGGTTGNLCNLSCREGYRYQGKANHTCLDRGRWDNFDDSHICEDATAPHFNGTCPADQIVYALPHKERAVVNWTNPQAFDEHSGILNVTSSKPQGVMLPDGTHAIVITATDLVGNVETCRFYVTVKVIRCQDEFLPSHAHMVGDCATVLGSNCSIGCQKGYTISGAATKKCVWDGESSQGTWEWEGNNPVCQAVMCPVIPNTDSMMIHGCMFASNGTHVPYGTRCIITCRNGGRRQFFSSIPPLGVKLTSCLADGTWSGDPECEADVTCPTFQLPDNAEWLRNRETCSADRVRAYTGCFVACSNGYTPRFQKNPGTMTRCLNGRWDPAISLECVDSTPPQFDPPCPRTYNFTTPPCLLSTNVTYPFPIATDNEGQNVTARYRGPPLPELLRRGGHGIMYRATDRNGNSQSCLVNIYVLAPMCPDDPAWRTGDVQVKSMSCRNIHGSTVRFHCTLPGMRLVGNPERVCQNNSQWSGMMPSCEPVTCPALALPPYTVASPSQCLTTPLVQGGTQCKVSCARGFASYPMRPIRTVCSDTGNWTADISGLQCTDTMSPVFNNCPPGMTVRLQPGASTARVTWSVPTATDNIGVVSTTEPDLTSPIDLAPGTELFTYTATDAQGLTGTCSFDVTVIDDQAPQAINCPSELMVVQAQILPVRVTYEEPMFTDNVGIAHIRNQQWFSRSRFVDSMAYEWGYTELHYQALDRANNMVECNLKFNIVNSTECPPLVAPPGSGLICDQSSTVCRLSCNMDYVFPTDDQTPLVFRCQPSGLWNNSSPQNENPYLPVCARRPSASTMRWTLTGEFAFTSNGDCHNVINSIQTRFLALFKTSNLVKACLSDGGTDCSFAPVTVSCDQSGDRDRPSRRRKRQTISGEASSAFVASVTMTATRQGTSVPAFFNQYNSSSVGNLWSEADTFLSLTNQTATLDPDRSRLSGFMPMCAGNQVASNFICVDCPPGSYKNQRSSSCEPCQKGWYQDLNGQTQCQRCQAGKSTRATGAYRPDQCQDMCNPGTYSYIGLVPDCLTCPVGTYQQRTGQRGCMPCVGNTTTSGPGASSSFSCIYPSDVTAAPPTTDNDIIEGGATQDSNRPIDGTLSATIKVNPSPAIVTTPQLPDTLTGRTDEGGRLRTPKKRIGQQGGNTGIIIGVCIALVVIVVIIIIVVVYYRRRSRSFPMMKLTTMQSTHDGSDDDEDGNVPTDGKYRQMTEMDNFDLEHLATFGDEDAAQAKRNSFSNALFQSEDDPNADRSGGGQVWTTFGDPVESQA